LSKIDESFKTHQYVYIHGRSGVGKTTLALRYASNIKKNQNQRIIWINNNSLVNTLKSLAEKIKIDLNDKLPFDQLLEKLKDKINDLTKKKKLSVMFFIDNLVYDQDDELKNDYQYLVYGFNDHIKFLITTKDQ